MSSKSRINPVVIRCVLAELSLCGINTATISRGMGFSVDALSDPQFFLSARQTSVILRRALKSFQYPGMGNVIGQRRSIVSSGMIGLGMMASANLREIFELIAYHPYALGTLLDVRMNNTAQGGLNITCAPSIDIDPAVEEFLVDEFFASMSTIAKAFAGVNHRFEGVSLKYKEPPHASQLRGFFSCPVSFGQPVHGIVVGRQALTVQNEAGDRYVVKAVIHELTKFDDSSSTSDLCQTVRRILLESMPDIPTMSQIGEIIHISERTLRRRFEEQNTSYQQLIDDARKEKALSLLKASALSVESVAIELGFADVRNFRRAFHRWTGKAPTALRKTMA